MNAESATKLPMYPIQSYCARSSSVLAPRKRKAAYAAQIVPPNTMLAMSRWMLIGIQVKLLTAAHTEPFSAPDSSTPAGEIMNVTHELATSRIAVPNRFESTPRLTWIHLREPLSQSQP